jgi:hypothetical protein
VAIVKPNRTYDPIYQEIEASGCTAHIGEKNCCTSKSGG